ncbi:Protein of unknown function [Gryllus bimaculatus]|nr:Protein of unknown function [Gryllus bimaculatus]
MLLFVIVTVVMRVTVAVEEETVTEDEGIAQDGFTSPSESDQKQDLKCPELDPYVASPCAFLCGWCPEGQICCKNNCGGTECMEPAKPHIPTEKELRFWKLYEQSIKPLKKISE